MKKSIVCLLAFAILASACGGAAKDDEARQPGLIENMASNIEAAEHVMDTFNKVSRNEPWFKHVKKTWTHARLRTQLAVRTDLPANAEASKATAQVICKALLDLVATKDRLEIQVEGVKQGQGQVRVDGSKQAGTISYGAISGFNSGSNGVCW